jgi:hypothetical protein
MCIRVCIWRGVYVLRGLSSRDTSVCLLFSPPRLVLGRPAAVAAAAAAHRTHSFPLSRADGVV